MTIPDNQLRALFKWTVELAPYAEVFDLIELLDILGVEDPESYMSKLEYMLHSLRSTGEP